MATLQLQRDEQEQKIESTVSTTLSSNIRTETQSLIFTQKLVALGLSTITYLRLNFPENAFADTCEHGLNLKILRDDSTYPAAQCLVSFIKGCFDALEKKYLRQMTLTISSSEDEETVLETYTFRFKYSGCGKTSLTQMETSAAKEHGSSSAIATSAMRMMRTILILGQSLEPLPEEVSLSMQLMYFDEVTPLNYEPPGFQASENDSLQFDGQPTTLKIGDVQTPYHSIKLRLRCHPSLCAMRDPENTDQKLELNEEPIRMLNRKSRTKVRLPMRFNVQPQSGSDGIAGTPVPSSTCNSPLSVIDNYQTPQRSIATISSVQGSVCSMRSEITRVSDNTKSLYPVRCPCDSVKDEGLMIICDVCAHWQHAACFTIVDSSQAPQRHVCHLCADPAELCTDPRLIFADPDLVQVTCLFRRALVWLYNNPEATVSASRLSHSLGTDVSIGIKFIDKLTNEGLLIDGKYRFSKNVDRQLLINDVLPKYVRAVQEKVATEATSIADDTSSHINFTHSQPPLATTDVQHLLPSQHSQSTICDMTDEKENEEPLPITTSKLKSNKRKKTNKVNKKLDYEISDSQSSSVQPERKTPRRSFGATTN